MAPSVVAEGLGKQYRLGAGVQGRLSEALWSRLEARFGSRDHDQPRKQTIWALKDVSLQVDQGEVVGIIGRNGAGKTTLLKIFSRITEPTSGYFELRGRAGSLLEVGSGFHPDLTGAENVYLYGSFLGMRRQEVRRKFDEIVSFAEVEQFIETPVKRYSSGMYMRLAFAVAAHLEPEILIVDEVLAVGDMAFQRKCLGKMEEVAGGGRTVLFVSHNMAAITSLCGRAYLLKSGSIARDGDARQVAQFYADDLAALQSVPLGEREDRGGDGTAKIVSLRIENADAPGPITCGSRLKLELGYESTGGGPLQSLRFVVTVCNSDGANIFRLDSYAEGGLPDVLPTNGTVRCTTEPVALTPGLCLVNASILRGTTVSDFLLRSAEFEVMADDFYPSGRIPRRSSALTLRRHTWTADEQRD
jgi:homopolymeric O-antigen transport system ATP-binding protein